MKFYKEQIEKTASVKEKAIAFAGNHKKKLIGAGIAGAGLGTAYLASPKDGKEKIKSGVKTVGKSVATAQINGQAQDTIKNIGGLIGTGIALKGGKSLGKAVVDGGLKGMAAGDILGATTIPTYQLYKKHKKEFGEGPDAKSLAMVMGANVLPTAAMWGGIYGLKNGAKHIKNNPGKLGKVIKKGGDAVSKSTDNFADGFGEVINAGKQIGKDYRSFVPKKPKELSKIIKKSKTGNLSPEDMRKYRDMVNAYSSSLDNATNLLSSVGGVDGAKQIIKKDLKSMTGGAKKAVGAFAPLAVAAEIAAVPTYVATPENVIKLKKKKQSEKEK